MFDDSYEFDIPEEIREWLNFQVEQGHIGMCYILEKGKATPKSWFEACLWWSSNKDACRVDRTEIDKDVYVSTVFLFLDHNVVNWAERWEGVDKEKPHLYETMIFGGTYDNYQWRYSTLGEAKAGHWKVVEALRANKEPQ